MSEQNAFNRSSFDIPPMAEPQGLLEQFNLPPGLIKFLRNNSKKIWIVVSIIALVVVAISLYNSYRDYKINQAASALHNALQSEVNKEAMLQKVSADFSSTPSARLAKIELASYYQQQQQYEKAAALLTELNTITPDSSLLKPLIILKLAGLYEKDNKLEMALGQYTVLSQMTGFEAAAYKAMGLIYEQQDKKEQAIAMYRKFIEIMANDDSAPNDPSKLMIESRLSLLEGNK